MSFVIRELAPKYLQNSRMCWLCKRVASVQSLSVANLELFLESLVGHGYLMLSVFATCLGIHLQTLKTLAKGEPLCDCFLITEVLVW